MAKSTELWHVPNLLAHRGASAHAPENTLAALRKAKELGAEWVEFDVKLDSRGEAIVFHDDKLHRTTNGRGYVARTPYKVIATLDAGSWFGPEFVGEQVPTLADWLVEASALGLGINLEMKLDRFQDAGLLANEVISHLARYWSNALPAPLISSFSKDCLAAIHARAPHLMLAYNIDHWPRAWKKVMTRFNCVSLHVNEKRIKAEQINVVKAEGYHMLAYTVNDARRAYELFDMGIDGVFANDPLILK